MFGLRFEANMFYQLEAKLTSLSGNFNYNTAKTHTHRPTLETETTFECLEDHLAF